MEKSLGYTEHVFHLMTSQRLDFANTVQGLIQLEKVFPVSLYRQQLLKHVQYSAYLKHLPAAPAVTETDVAVVFPDQEVLTRWTQLQKVITHFASLLQLVALTHHRLC